MPGIGGFIAPAMLWPFSLNSVYGMLSTGFASQPQATNRDDGMKLTDAYITAAVRCAPPANKPTPGERDTCRTWLTQRNRRPELFGELVREQVSC